MKFSLVAILFAATAIAAPQHHKGKGTATGSAHPDPTGHHRSGHHTHHTATGTARGPAPTSKGKRNGPDGEDDFAGQQQELAKPSGPFSGFPTGPFPTGPFPTGPLPTGLFPSGLFPSGLFPPGLGGPLPTASAGTKN